MSFSAYMDSLVVPDTPTPPVSPKPPPRRLYHSESVGNAMSQLSKELSGFLENTIFSSKADKEMPPPFGLLPGQPIHPREPGPSGLKRSTSFNRGASEPLENTPSTSATQVASATLEALKPPSLNFLDLDTSATLNSAKLLVPPTVQPAAVTTAPSAPSNSSEEPLRGLINFLTSQANEKTVDPVLLSTTLSPASPPPTVPNTPVPALFKTTSPGPASDLPPLYNAPAPAPSSQSTTSSTVSPLPGINIISPTPSTPNLSFDGPLSEPVSETDDEYEDEYKPDNAKRAFGNAASRAGRRTGAPRPKGKTTRPKAQVANEAFNTSPEASLSPASPASLIAQPFVLPRPTAPDAEANSDYQCSENGVDNFYDNQQNIYSGGPRRDSRRSSTSGTHPYKNLKTKAALGGGRQVCDYVSPYDGWKCEQVLARTYDLPRHMEVHAKEEYDLVLTGKLDVTQSKLFDDVTEANVYICLICRKDFSRKDAMQRHIRNASKMSKAKHRSEGKASIKKRVLGLPISQHPNIVPPHILQKHRLILEKLKIEAQDLGQDVTDWDVENMIPQTSNNVENLYGTPNNAPGIPVGRRTGNRNAKTEDATLGAGAFRPTRASTRIAGGTKYDDESEDDGVRKSVNITQAAMELD